MKISYPTILPFAGGIIGIAMSLSYYASIMIAQLFIGRPSSTWVLGIFWIPVLVMKPGLVGFLTGVIVWLLVRPFYKPRSLSLAEIKIVRLCLILLLSASVAAGVLKVVMGAVR